MTRLERIEFLEKLALELAADVGADYKVVHEIGVLMTRCDEMSARLEEKSDIDELREHVHRLEELTKVSRGGAVLLDPRTTRVS